MAMSIDLYRCDLSIERQLLLSTSFPISAITLFAHISHPYTAVYRVTQSMCLP